MIQATFVLNSLCISPNTAFSISTLGKAKHKHKKFWLPPEYLLRTEVQALLTLLLLLPKILRFNLIHVHLSVTLHL